jgi:hypothetical protein
MKLSLDLAVDYSSLEAGVNVAKKISRMPGVNSSYVLSMQFAIFQP